MRLRPLAWKLEEQVWARRSYRRILALNRAEAPTVAEGATQFGAAAQQVLLWCAPRAPTPRQLGVIMFIHGGGWHSGDPAYHRFVGRHFATQGYFAVVVGYRLAPQHVFPAPLEDVHLAVRTGLTLARAAGWPGPAILVGQSAGAHLVALLVYGGAQLLTATVDPQTVGGLVLLGGPLSLAACRSAALQAALRALAGPAHTVAELDPLRYVRGDEGVAVLCVHGAKDYLVERENALAFSARVNAAGEHRGQVLLLPRAHHADLLELFLTPSAAATAVHAWIDQRVLPA